MLVDLLLQSLGFVVVGVQSTLDVVWPSAGAYGVDARFVLGRAIPLLALIPLVLTALPLERRRPIENHDSREARATIRHEWLLVAFMAAIRLCVQIAMFVGFGRLVMAYGKPLLYLEAQSVLGTLALVLVYALYVDCVKYWMHRLSHRIPALWAVHSFHHSAERLTVATGARHHWTEEVVFAPLVVLAVTIFQVPGSIVSMALLLTQVQDAAQHVNYKIAWHRVGIWVNTPWWHRIHHSVEPKHYDKNFSIAFPIMDVIFGTAYYPAPDEYPETGLRPRQDPKLWEGIIWPFRGWLGYRHRERLEGVRPRNPADQSADDGGRGVNGTIEVV